MYTDVLKTAYHNSFLPVFLASQITQKIVLIYLHSKLITHGTKDFIGAKTNQIVCKYQE